MSKDVNIHVAFRFHGNFYHSYRGDTPDELGFGKDIRIIRHIIKELDDLNASGIPVRGTWDFENYFSYEKIMPEHCPDIIEDMQRRVKSGLDEAQFMSWNNGLVSASTPKEFDASMSRAISNPEGSGLKDLFGTYGSMVRPQEMMYTPIHLKMYKNLGINAISLYYSALPFNGFSNFVPLLSVEERYNPLTLSYPGIDETMTLMPSFNVGDLLDNLSIRKWVKRMRRLQLKMEKPKDLMLLVDMDADDEFWCGFGVPVVSQLWRTVDGLRGLVESVSNLNYVVFDTPSSYLENHEPVGEISIGQDTADGSFDGISSWAEKWSNQRIWTGVDRSRLMEMQSGALMKSAAPAAAKKAEKLLAEAFEKRVRLMSTTHFGMSAPVMNLTRLGIARDLARDFVLKSSEALALLKKGAVKDLKKNELNLMDYRRGVASGVVSFKTKPSRCLVKIPLKDGDTPVKLFKGTKNIPAAQINNSEGSVLLFVEEMKAGKNSTFSLEKSNKETSSPKIKNPVVIHSSGIGNGLVEIHLDEKGLCVGITGRAGNFESASLLGSSVSYGSQRVDVTDWQIIKKEVYASGVAGNIILKGEVTLPGRGNKKVTFTREILLAAGLPWFYVTMTVDYPETNHKGYGKGKAKRLQQTWDDRWKEVMPCEINPNITGTDESRLKIWKHNYCGHVSTFDLHYGTFSKNRVLDSVNNQVTNGWVAVSNGSRGLLVAQTADELTSMAFCPVRTREEGGELSIRLNPFGSYSGTQYQYDSAYTGIGRFLAIQASASDHIKPYAPSYAGHRQRFTIMIAPYRGDEPPADLQNDALAFAWPHIMLTKSNLIDEVPALSWIYEGEK